MGGLGSHVRALASNRWLVLAASILTQACSGVGYAFGSYSPIVKSTLGYNQNQISRLGVAKDIGDNVGILAGTLCDYLPTWGLFVCGAALNLVGYGWLWLIVTAQVPPPPFWVVSDFSTLSSRVLEIVYAVECVADCGSVWRWRCGRCA